MTVPAVLVLADGSVFRGVSIGAEGASVGEVVFNTAMTGYQEVLTDPSYAKQMVTLTYPHIGNVGVNDEDAESTRVWAAGLIIRDLPRLLSSFRAQQSLPDFLKNQHVVAIAGVDTRKLTRLLREKGAQSGCLMAGDNINIEEALLKAQSFTGLAGLDLAKVVSIKEPYTWTQNVWQLASQPKPLASVAGKFKVVAYDFGVKQNILRMLVERGCEVTVVPAQTSATQALSYKPDGIFLSNGPGDPEPCDYAIEAIKEFIAQKVPLFGICLGHQLLGLASGAKTMKMKFGHHGANHPVQDLTSGRVMITSQNHGFAVDATTLPDHCRVTHVSLFDQSLQGIARTDCPAFSFQGHPEASPGPHEAASLFDHFIDLMKANSP
ncbi:MAG: carbamoyl phosphate synthase small subunit [Ferrovum sp. 37-45-19]|uniref:glutamine-hydrolyzing carbamoyl-phosphate synthase small subunit n=1 Tax=Ferrovum sp. JA12 TaxID=1356299 RepID=UPI0007037CF8|nr:MAG: carbamoyl phosphate synthase small subunit [Ferrovum sp. 21-44-67]OYV94400.1 MAG: carbamoyl phosphate synthase small subunit [Ferrovum sp. 37-45-19]OZB32369.1 MAG: carbamoyl phosphate synthase small subunit [Ferrovum sp. 34-44-207]HQU06687.1 glutamine-hydrolyzing carbamoyl-phosphate synthase small subunit [Ferrovaceae bacterium]